MRSKVILLGLASLTLLAVPQAAHAQIESNFSSGGGVRIGASTSTCDASVSGAIRYNSGSGGSIDFCNGSIWQNVGASGAASPDRGIQFNSGGSHSAASNLVYSSQGAFMVSGTHTGASGVPVFGAGTRMFFDPKKSAFRAGYVDGTQWDDANIGNYSVAMGGNTRATGNYGVALGNGNFTGSGDGNVAIGSGNTAAVTTWGGAAIGADNYVSGGAGVSALGRGNTVSGDGSVAVGAVNLANSHYAYTFGRQNVASSFGIALGFNSQVSGAYSAAIGLVEEPTGVRPVVAGANSLGIFMGDQTGVIFSSANTMGVFGGRMVIDPRVPAQQLAARSALDLGAATDSILVPRGTTAQRPASPVNGMVRYNSQTEKFEGYQAGAWVDVIGGGASAASPDRGVQFNSGGSFAASSSFVYTSAGRLGIATTTPQTTLDVNGEARVGITGVSCSASLSGAMRYSSANGGAIEFCNGTDWTRMAQIQSASGPTAPPGSGYFVLTHTTWNGNLGGITGADAKCLTELSTTYTSWRGYTTANANGQLTAAKVKAFLCDEYGCNHLMPLTTYYFAYANSGTPGGAGFTTDASGLGPNDNSNWSAANYFSGTYTYWMNREDLTSTQWGDVADWNSYNSCNSWVNGTTSDDGEIGSSSNTDGRRFWNSSAVCNTTRRLICFVNP